MYIMPIIMLPAARLWNFMNTIPVLSFTVQKCSIQLGLQVYIVKLQNLIDTVNTVDQDKFRAQLL